MSRIYGRRTYEEIEADLHREIFHHRGKPKKTILPFTFREIKAKLIKNDRALKPDSSYKNDSYKVK